MKSQTMDKIGCVLIFIMTGMYTIDGIPRKFGSIATSFCYSDQVFLKVS